VDFDSPTSVSQILLGDAPKGSPAQTTGLQPEEHGVLTRGSQLNIDLESESRVTHGKQLATDR
jgi:hypothetical protein